MPLTTSIGWAVGANGERNGGLGTVEETKGALGGCRFIDVGLLRAGSWRTLPPPRLAGFARLASSDGPASSVPAGDVSLRTASESECRLRVLRPSVVRPCACSLRLRARPAAQIQPRPPTPAVPPNDLPLDLPPSFILPPMPAPTPNKRPFGGKAKASGGSGGGGAGGGAGERKRGFRVGPAHAPKDAYLGKGPSSSLPPSVLPGAPRLTGPLPRLAPDDRQQRRSSRA